MSDQLEAAIESLRQVDLSIEAAEAEGLAAVGDAMGHLRIAVNHLAGAVQRLELKADDG